MTPSTRGFTLIEVLLAATLGGVVVLSALGVAMAMQRSEQRLGDRGAAVAELATLHGVVQKALLNIVATDAARPVGNTAGDADSVNLDLTQQETTELERPRIILGPDPSLVSRGREPIQSLEIVLRTPPAAFSLAQTITEEEAIAIEETRSAVRGVFELRPENDGAGYELWWRPLLPTGEPMSPSATNSDTNTATDARDLSALRLAGDITGLRWQMLKTRVGAETLTRDRLIEHQATWVDELPAYIELEVATEQGVYANWMFEIGWTLGPEIVSPPTDDTDDTDGAGGAGGAGGANGGGDGAGAGGGAPQGRNLGGGRGGPRDGARVPGGRPGQRQAPQGQPPTRDGGEG